MRKIYVFTILGRSYNWNYRCMLKTRIKEHKTSNAEDTEKYLDINIPKSKTETFSQTVKNM